MKNENVNKFISQLNKNNLDLKNKIELNNLKINILKKIKHIKIPKNFDFFIKNKKPYFFISFENFLNILPNEKIYLFKEGYDILYEGIPFFKQIKVNNYDKYITFYCYHDIAEYDNNNLCISCIKKINFSFLSEKQNKFIKKNIIKKISEENFISKNIEIEDEYIRKMITLQ